MKTLFWLCIIGGALMLWSKHHAKSGASGPAASESSGEKTLVTINFTDNQDLLAQLRRMPAGHYVSTNYVGSLTGVSTGLACSDKAAVAAYEADMNRKLAEEKRLIEIEFKRIEGR